MDPGILPREVASCWPGLVRGAGGPPGPEVGAPASTTTFPPSPKMERDLPVLLLNPQTSDQCVPEEQSHRQSQSE